MNTKKMSKKHVTNEDIIAKIDGIAEKLDEKINSISMRLDQKIDNVSLKLDALAEDMALLTKSTAKGFEGNDRRFDAIDTRLSKVEDNYMRNPKLGFLN